MYRLHKYCHSLLYTYCSSRYNVKALMVLLGDVPVILMFLYKYFSLIKIQPSLVLLPLRVRITGLGGERVINPSKRSKLQFT